MSKRTNWSKVSPIVRDVALACCRGEYQRNIVLGWENLSGSTLRGRASSYGAHYARSRRNLLRRLRSAGLHVSEMSGANNARILVVQPTFVGDGI